MSNLQFDKLKFIEYVVGESFGTNNNETLMQQTEIKELQKFFKINYNELVVLSILIEGGIRQEELGIDAFLEYFGGGLSGIKHINKALHSLISKGYVVSTTKNKFSKTLIKQTFQVDEKIYEALLENKQERLEFKPAENFNQLLKNVNEIFRKRKDGCFDATTLKKLVERELNAATKDESLNWLNSFSNLTLEDKILFLFAAYTHQKDEEQIDLEFHIKQIEDNFSKQKAFRDSIANKTSSLVTNDLLLKEEDGFVFDEFVGLTEKSKNALFQKETNKAKKKAFSTATILQPEDIFLEELFYNESEWQQINTIEKILSKEKHQLVVNQLMDNGLAKGISIIFNGSSGTGKTATAKRLAKITNRPLFCVDVEKIANKWIGDSEKNTKKIFDEYYEFSNQCELTPILFFNEDSIFSKRVDVGHSSDRTHNSMQNILLEQMEQFSGISIVTSNHAEKLDKAFERRFLYKVEFEKPTKETQFSLLSNAFQNISKDTINTILEDYSFTGGQIYNIRKKYIMQCIIEDVNLDELFIKLCKEESETKTSQKIGFNINN
ncbi:AAA family ATPase [Flavobacterium sp.]|uniref:ATP-binding protein n=1 Tax=Flavobacterium sp. TaxID=239 RepID=UPI001B65D620|nr:AAA family ATPase [Flavobacterium sp.]MBP6126661.1 ATP-binding protein [Flavobacterium sp.]